MSSAPSPTDCSPSPNPPPAKFDSQELAKSLFEQNARGELVPSKDLKKNMDTANANILDVWHTQGEQAAVAAMFTGDNGETLSYSEMRMRYG